MYTHSKPRWLVMLLASVAITAAGYAQDSVAYFIQAGAYDSEQEASAALAILQRNCSPVTIQQKNGAKPYKVCVGQFSTYLDAWSTRQKLKAGFPADAFITTATASGGGRIDNVLPVDAPFNGPALSTVDATDYWDVGGFGNDAEPPAVLLEATTSMLNRDELLQAGLTAPKHPFTGVQPLEEFLKRYADDPKADHVRLRLARVYGRGSNAARAEVLLNKVLRDGSPTARGMARFIGAHVKLNRHATAEAYEEFRSVANDGTLPGEVRRQAMWRAAAVAHSQQHYADSWLAYKHILSVSGESSETAEARVQMAGLMFEMVKRSKGSWDEVRAICQSVSESADAPRSKQATAELMYLETFFEQQRFAEAAAMADAYVAKYADVKRESYIAQVWKGLCLVNLNRMDEAKAPLEQVASAEIAPGEKFANSEPAARAAVWLAYIAKKQGNPVERARWVDLLKAQYPDGPETRALPQIIGTN